MKVGGIKQKCNDSLDEEQTNEFLFQCSARFSYDMVTYDIVKTYNFMKQHTSAELWSTVGEKLRLFIDSLHTACIDVSFMRKLMPVYFDAGNFRTKEEKELFFRIETLFKAAVVYYLIQKNSYLDNPIVLNSPKELMQAYPQFQNENCGDKEVMYLMNFCTAMRMAVRVIPPRLKKKLLIAICAKLEGSGKLYITGGCQHRTTERRVIIYEQESGVKPVPRPPRRAPTEEEIQERKKRKLEAASVRAQVVEQPRNTEC